MVLITLLAYGCSEPLSPREVAGMYELRLVAGDPLPAVLFDNGFESVRALAETLTFMANGHGVQHTVTERKFASGAPTDTSASVFGFVFGIVDDRIEVAYPCPPGADCIAPPHIVLQRTSDGLRATYDIGARTPLTYTRIR